MVERLAMDGSSQSTLGGGGWRKGGAREGSQHGRLLGTGAADRGLTVASYRGRWRSWEGEEKVPTEFARGSEEAGECGGGYREMGKGAAMSAFL